MRKVTTMMKEEESPRVVRSPSMSCPIGCPHKIEHNDHVRPARVAGNGGDSCCIASRSGECLNYIKGALLLSVEWGVANSCRCLRLCASSWMYGAAVGMLKTICDRVVTSVTFGKRYPRAT